MIAAWLHAIAVALVWPSVAVAADHEKHTCSCNPAYAYTWSHFRTGSWVAYQVTEPVNDVDLRVTRCKHELFAGSDGKPSARTISEWRQNRYVPTSQQALVGARRLDDLSRDKSNPQQLTVAGRSCRCQVTTYRGKPPLADDMTCIVWTTTDLQVPARVFEAPGGLTLALPPNVVRMDYTNQRPGYEATIGIQVVQLDAAQYISGQPHACVLEQHDGLDLRDGRRERLISRVWLSKLVPGHIVRREQTLTRGAVSTQRTLTVVSYDGTEHTTPVPDQSSILLEP